MCSFNMYMYRSNVCMLLYSLSEMYRIVDGRSGMTTENHKGNGYSNGQFKLPYALLNAVLEGYLLDLMCLGNRAVYMYME